MTLKMKPRKAVIVVRLAALCCAAALFSSIGCKRSATADASSPTQKPLVASLLGHWVKKDGRTHRYFSLDTVIMVDENRVRPQSYRVVKSNEQAGTMTICCEGKNDQYSLPGALPVFYDLEFSKDRKAVRTRSYLRETDSPIASEWTYVDAAREP